MRVTKLFVLLVFPIIMGISFASCSDDDKDELPLDNSSVVGNWNFKEVTSTFKFSDAFIKDKSEEELAEFTTLVDNYLKTVSGKEVVDLTDSKFKLETDYKVALQVKNDKGELETKNGIYVLDPAFKFITFTLDTDGSRKFDLDGATMSYDKAIAPADVSLGTGEESGIKSEDIKSASVTHVYIKTSK